MKQAEHGRHADHCHQANAGEEEFDPTKPQRQQHKRYPDTEADLSVHGEAKDPSVSLVELLVALPPTHRFTPLVV